MFKKVLIPLDGSSFAENILPLIQRILPPTQSELVLLSAIDQWRYGFASDDSIALEMWKPLFEEKEAYLAEQSRLLQERGYHVTTQIADGDAAHAILDGAQSIEADLIAMTTHGHSGVTRLALGSVAERILQKAEIPILLVREATDTPHIQLQRIVVPLDGSDASLAALPVAQSLVQDTDAEILLLHVIQQLDETNRQLIFRDSAQADAAFAKWNQKVEESLQQIAEQVQNNGIPCNYRIVVGDPETGICQSAVDEDADLIVMSTHGRSGLGRWFYGSVANKVLRSASRPILLVRSQ